MEEDGTKNEHRDEGPTEVYPKVSPSLRMNKRFRQMESTQEINRSSV